MLIVDALSVSHLGGLNPVVAGVYLFKGVVDGITASSVSGSSSIQMLQEFVIRLGKRADSASGAPGNEHIRRSEELLEQHVHSSGHLGHEEKLAHAVEGALAVPGPLDALALAEVLRRRPVGRGVASLLLGGGAKGDERGGGRARGRRRDGGSGQLAAGQHGRGGCQGRRHLIRGKSSSNCKRTLAIDVVPGPVGVRWRWRWNLG